MAGSTGTRVRSTVLLGLVATAAFLAPLTGLAQSGEKTHFGACTLSLEPLSGASGLPTLHLHTEIFPYQSYMSPYYDREAAMAFESEGGLQGLKGYYLAFPRFCNVFPTRAAAQAWLDRSWESRAGHEYRRIDWYPGKNAPAARPETPRPKPPPTSPQASSGPALTGPLLVITSPTDTPKGWTPRQLAEAREYAASQAKKLALAKRYEAETQRKRKAFLEQLKRRGSAQ